MSIQPVQPKLYVSVPHNCPYLPSETATTLLLEPNYPINGKLFNLLLKSGFRRSGPTVYKPQCRHCKACVSVKIPVNEYRPNRSQRRCLQNNKDIHLSLIPAQYKEEHFQLYCKYQAWRHPTDIMDHRDKNLYGEYMVHSNVESVFIEFRLEKKLVALSVCDLADDGLSAVYTFFDPHVPKRGLGNFAILAQVDYVKKMNLDWLYLGYWIKNCRKMSYKINFRPLFGYVEKEWRLIAK